MLGALMEILLLMLKDTMLLFLTFVGPNLNYKKSHQKLLRLFYWIIMCIAFFFGTCFDSFRSAMKENQDEPNCYFDMNRSGATLAWDFFFPGVETPMVYQYCFSLTSLSSFDMLKIAIYGGGPSLVPKSSMWHTT